MTVHSPIVDWRNAWRSWLTPVVYQRLRFSPEHTCLVKCQGNSAHTRFTCPVYVCKRNRHVKNRFSNKLFGYNIGGKVTKLLKSFVFFSCVSINVNFLMVNVYYFFGIEILVRMFIKTFQSLMKSIKQDSIYFIKTAQLLLNFHQYGIILYIFIS